MKDLENKGINWSDNIYYKFEGIIPDVNDTMIQVCHQLQTVNIMIA